MTVPLSREYLSAVKKRVEAVSEGWVSAYGVYVVTLDDSGKERVVAECETKDEAHFIGEARQDIPKMLAEIERLRDINERLVRKYYDAEELLSDMYDLLEDSIYTDTIQFEDLCDFYNIGGDSE